MYSERAKLWLRFLLSSFAAMIFAMALISVALYHNGLIDALRQSFLPSLGVAFLFSMVVFLRPQN
jgi:hypothetical protein